MTTGWRYCYGNDVIPLPGTLPLHSPSKEVIQMSSRQVKPPVYSIKANVEAPYSVHHYRIPSLFTTSHFIALSTTFAFPIHRVRSDLRPSLPCFGLRLPCYRTNPDVTIQPSIFKPRPRPTATQTLRQQPHGFLQRHQSCRTHGSQRAPYRPHHHEGGHHTSRVV